MPAAAGTSRRLPITRTSSSAGGCGCSAAIFVRAEGRGSSQASRHLRRREPRAGARLRAQCAAHGLFAARGVDVAAGAAGRAAARYRPRPAHHTVQPRQRRRHRAAAMARDRATPPPARGEGAPAPRSASEAPGGSSARSGTCGWWALEASPGPRSMWRAVCATARLRGRAALPDRAPARPPVSKAARSGCRRQRSRGCWDSATSWPCSPTGDERRARLQGQRRRSNREIIERFGANWTSAVPCRRGWTCTWHLARGHARGLACKTSRKAKGRRQKGERQKPPTQAPRLKTQDYRPSSHAVCRLPSAGP